MTKTMKWFPHPLIQCRCRNLPYRVIVFWQQDSPAIRIHWSALHLFACKRCLNENVSAGPLIKRRLTDRIRMNRKAYRWIEVYLVPVGHLPPVHLVWAANSSSLSNIRICHGLLPDSLMCCMPPGDLCCDLAVYLLIGCILITIRTTIV